MREEERNLIKRMVAGNHSAADEFVSRWDFRIHGWVARNAYHEKVEEYAQEVWAHLIQGNWLRLLQWQALYDDDAWHEHSLEAYLKRITINKVAEPRRSKHQPHETETRNNTHHTTPHHQTNAKRTTYR